MFLRFQSAVPNRRGTFPGIFAMANRLRDQGRLTAEDQTWMRIRNADGERVYTDPSTVMPDCYDPIVNPGARSWFRADATSLLEMARGYTELLNRYSVPWIELRTATPGRLVYEDEVQVVAVPFTHDVHWPLR